MIDEEMALRPRNYTLLLKHKSWTAVSEEQKAGRTTSEEERERLGNGEERDTTTGRDSGWLLTVASILQRRGDRDFEGVTFECADFSSDRWLTPCIWIDLKVMEFR